MKYRARESKSGRGIGIERESEGERVKSRSMRRVWHGG